jgi:hypothetical protein
VHGAQARFDLDYLGSISQSRSAEDVDLATARYELPRELQDVHVETTGLGPAGTRQGRGVDAEYGNTHGVIHEERLRRMR